MLKKTMLILTSTILLLATDIESIYFQNACNSCHGMYAEGMGTAPKLQGKKEAVLLKRLKELQKGKTKTTSGSVMISFAKSLNDEQTVAMAKYLSSLKTSINPERYDEEYDPAGDGGS